MNYHQVKRSKGCNLPSTDNYRLHNTRWWIGSRGLEDCKCLSNFFLDKHLLDKHLLDKPCWDSSISLLLFKYFTKACLINFSNSLQHWIVKLNGLKLKRRYWPLQLLSLSNNFFPFKHCSLSNIFSFQTFSIFFFIFWTNIQTFFENVWKEKMFEREQCLKGTKIVWKGQKLKRSIGRFNFRPLSLTIQCCKLFEKLMRHALVKYLKSNKLIEESQHGFRSSDIKRSCLKLPE